MAPQQGGRHTTNTDRVEAKQRSLELQRCVRRIKHFGELFSFEILLYRVEAAPVPSGRPHNTTPFPSYMPVSYVEDLV